jgi:hypothetical protein
MSHKLPNAAGFLSQLTGALICAVCLAYLQWLANRDSITEPETPVLIKYLLLNVACFLILFFVIRFILSSDAKRFLSYLILAVVGAVLSSVLIDIRFVLNNWGYREIAEAHYAGIRNAVIYVVVLNCVVTMFIMSLVFAVAFVVRSLKHRFVKPRLRVNSGGI